MSLVTNLWRIILTFVIFSLSIYLLSIAQSQSTYILRLNSMFGTALPHEIQRLVNFGQPEAFGLAQWIHVSIRNEFIFPGNSENQSDLGKHLETIGRLNPFYSTQYFDGAHLLILLADDGISAQKQVNTSISLHERFLSLDPIWTKTHWTPIENLWLLLGYTRIYELGDLTGAKEAFAQVIKNPRLKTWFEPLVRRLETPQGRYEVAIRLFQDLVRRYSDEETLKDTAQRNLQQTLIGYSLYQLNRGTPKSTVDPLILQKIFFNENTRKYEPRDKMNLLKGLEL